MILLKYQSIKLHIFRSFRLKSSIAQLFVLISPRNLRKIDLQGIFIWAICIVQLRPHLLPGE